MNSHRIVFPIGPFECMDSIIATSGFMYYAGFIPLDRFSRARYTDFVNKRATDINANFTTSAQLKSLPYIQDVQIVFNNYYLQKATAAAVMDTMLILYDDMGIHNFIVTDPTIIFSKRIRKLLPHLTLSNEAYVLSESEIRFYRDAGVNHFIIPRQVMMQEVVRIGKKYPDCTFEIFALNEGPFICGGGCFAAHKKFHNSLCYDLSLANSAGFLFTPVKAEQASVTKCGMCSLYATRELENVRYKIVGRTLDISVKQVWANAIRNILSDLSDDVCPTTNDIKKTIGEAFAHSEAFRCNRDFCYYPEFLPDRD